jgi:hypothetical protein
VKTWFQAFAFKWVNLYRYASAHNCEHQSELLVAAAGMMAEAR